MTHPHRPVGSSGPLLEILAVSREFGYRRILEDIDLELNPGELTLLLGRNGSGKSTLMKIVAGLLHPSKGAIRFAGVELARNPEAYRRSVGMISHHSHLYGDLTARENLVFQARLARAPEMDRGVTAALDAVGLSPFADLLVKTFSSGMSKRLSIARLIVLKPRVLLLDEPYTGLDYDSTDFFNRYLADFKKDGGTILLISHQIETCYSLCDHIAILEQRKLKRRYRAKDYHCSDLIREYHQTARI
jgi:heme ABC exporter ATP-binding subunit CcmA